MGEPMVVDGGPFMDLGVKGSSVQKRKRASSGEWLAPEEREARAEILRAELQGLFRFFREMADGSVAGSGLLQLGASPSSVVACLIEESSKPLSKLVEEVFEKVKGIEGISGTTMASVKSTVLMIAQRTCYGVPNAEADLLEDERESCLWCWETRDLKLMPKSIRGAIKIRRTGRKKIHERVSAVSAMLAALQNFESHQNSKHDLPRALEKLFKVLREADIRILVASMIEKSSADMAVKKVEQEEKVLIKQLEKNKREAEKERKRSDREILKEKEKELKWLQEKEEALRDEKHHEKEESEMRKQLKKQQEEADKEQRRKEKEEVELRKQLAIQKQASLMERFLKRAKNNSTSKSGQSSENASTPDYPMNKRKDLLDPATQSMDFALAHKDEINNEDLLSTHLNSWRSMHRHIRSNGKHWGMRRMPKTQLIKELTLTSRDIHDNEFAMEKLIGGGDLNIDEKSCNNPADSALTDLQKRSRSKQLLQFDKSHRPAFYGIWPNKSKIIGPRHPFSKDSGLDYDIDSDEEWEEEVPGESLSDCDKDDEEDSEGCLKPDDEDENEDGFFVPDGYLSGNEGVQSDRGDPDEVVEQVQSPCKQQEPEDEGLHVLLKLQKSMHCLTEHALRKNQPLTILNLMHEKGTLLMAADLSGTAKIKNTCLQALSMLAFPGGPPLEISLDDNMNDDDHEVCLSNSKECNMPSPAVISIPDSDLPKVVSTIQSCTQSIHKVVELLKEIFPSISKTQLRSKVREISVFVDSRWQVKKDVLNKLGLSDSPEKARGGKTMSIVSFFSKRCHPPADACQSQ